MNPVEHYIALTRSSHPSPQLAVHALGKQGHMLILGQSEHAMSHGEKLLRDIVYDGCHKAELANEDPVRKRLRSEDLSFVQITAPPNQPARFSEVQADPTSTWRAGIDLSCEEVDLEKAIVELCAQELNSMDLAVRDRDGCKQLVTTRALKEGQKIGNVSCLSFSTKGVMRDFLNKGGNVALTDAPLLEVGNVETIDMLDGIGSTSVYSVPVGVGRLLMDHRHARAKFPNVELVCCPELGPNDGFIQFRVKTHNQCGISSDKALTVDFGDGWHLSTVGTSDAAKRFKGSLDLFWRKVATDDDDGGCDGSPSKSDIGEPPTKKPKLADVAALPDTKPFPVQSPEPLPPKPSPEPSLPNKSAVTLATGEQMLGENDGVTTLLDANNAISLLCDITGAISAALSSISLVSQQCLTSISAVPQ